MIWIPIWTAQMSTLTVPCLCCMIKVSADIFNFSHLFSQQRQPSLCLRIPMPRSAGPDAATTELLSLAVCSSAQWSPHSSKPSSMLSRLDIKTQTLAPCIGDTQWVHHSHHSLMAEHFSFISSISRLEMKSGTKLAFNELLHDISVVEQIVKLFHSP